MIFMKKIKKHLTQRLIGIFMKKYKVIASKFYYAIRGGILFFWQLFFFFYG